MRDGVGASCVVLPTHGQGSMLDFLAERLPAVDRAAWQARMQAGDVVDERGATVEPARPFEGGLRVYYYRHLDDEPEIPFTETVLYQDEHLLVADKPHFMPVTPSGRYLQHTLLVRLKRRLGLPELSPLHRIDRDTAGLVLFSVQQRTRGAYQALFRDRTITKHYEAVAPWRDDLVFPREHRSRMEESPQFFRMHEVPARQTATPTCRCCSTAATGRCTACRPSPASATSCACTWPRWVCPCATTRSTRWSMIRRRATTRARFSCWHARWHSPIRSRAMAGNSPAGCSSIHWIDQPRGTLPRATAST